MLKKYFLQENTKAPKKYILLGDFLHLILYFLPQLKPDQSSLDQALEKAWAFFAQKQSLLYLHKEKNIQDLIQHKQIREKFYIILTLLQEKNFTACTKELKEQEVIDARGNIYRIDRVLVFPEKLVILDLKLSKQEDSEENHKKQLKVYQQLLQNIFKKETEAYLIYFEEEELRPVLWVQAILSTPRKTSYKQ